MFNFFRFATASNIIKLCDPDFNSKEIIEVIQKCNNFDVQLLVFPQLSITGSSCLDLFKQKELLSKTESSIKNILSTTKNFNMYIFCSIPIFIQNRLCNCSILINQGSILGIFPKKDLNILEKRYFDTFDLDISSTNYCSQNVNIYSNNKIIINDSYVLEISYDNIKNCTQSDIVIIQDSSPCNITKINDTIESAKSISKMYDQIILYANTGFGESTTDYVYDGQNFVAQSNKILCNSNNFSLSSTFCYCDVDFDMCIKPKKIPDFCISIHLNQNLNKNILPKISQNPFLPETSAQFENMINILKTSLITRLYHVNLHKLVIGVSGGVDSTLALLICIFVKDTLSSERKDILGITMPGFGTSDLTYKNATKLMKLLGISTLEIDIKDACNLHFKDIMHTSNNHDVTFENTQARERTQILFDISNKENAIVVGTGDFTELALGYCTFNGDHMSNYCINSNIPKTVVKEIIKYISSLDYFDSEIKNTLLDICNTDISPELLPTLDGKIAQKTENIVGPYELNDFFLFYVLKYGYSFEKIIFLANNAFRDKYSTEQLKMRLEFFYKRFVSQQFKRNCSPEGPSIYDISFSPRNGLLMPSDANNFFEQK